MNWPNIATSEEGDIVWCLPETPMMDVYVYLEGWGMPEEAYLDNPTYVQACLDLLNTEWSDEWLLRELHEDDIDSNQRTYIRWDMASD